MTKIGRNDKCPCGSGKKYKKCCLTEVNNDKHYADISSILHLRCINEHLLTEERTTVDFSHVYTEYCNNNGFANTENLQVDDQFFHKLLKFIEEMIIDICTVYSAYELFFWYRRIRPINRYDNRSVYNYHELIKQSIFMFGGKQDVFKVTMVNNLDGIAPAYISHIQVADIFTCNIPNEVVDILSDIYTLESVCFYYIYVCNCYRLFNKGGEYYPDKDIGFTIKIANSDLDFLINYYDERSRSQSLLTNIGSFSNESKREKDKLILPFLYHNFDSERQDVLDIAFTSDHDSFNFLISSIDLSDYYEFSQKFNPIIFQKYNFYIEDILSIILYFSHSMSASLSPLLVKDGNSDDRKVLIAISTMQRAYTIIEDSETNRREYVADFKKIHSSLFPHLPEATTKNILNAYGFLFFQSGNYDSLENELLKGFLFNKITKDKIVVDYTAFVPVLLNFLTPFSSVDGEYGNFISDDLETKVNQKIIELYGGEAVHLRGEIKNYNGAKKEIDAALIIDHFMFICECKSLSVSEGSILGTRNAVEFRKKKIMGYLSEVEAKADFLLNNEGRLNKIIPSSIKYLVPLVITSFPEFIWERTENLFISEKISRILTINELDLIKAITSFDDLKNKPFVRKLKNV